MSIKRIAVSFAAAGTALTMLPLFAAFEAHVINVTARIENALSVPVEAINFGTVFPQEQLEENVGIRLSGSFQDEEDADDVEYVIRQKPKCFDPQATSTHGRVTEDESGENFVCEDEGFEMFPLLCPYLSKHPDGNPEPGNDGSLDAFHGPISGWDPQDTVNLQVLGRLAKSDQDFEDTWVIDLKVPCFGDNCGQDWANYVDEINPQADPDAYIQPEENEHEIFGCDLWIEVTGVSRFSDPE